jgi:hypothetical protein
MRQLMREQKAPTRRLRSPCLRSKDDVIADGERSAAGIARGFVSARLGVNAHATEIRLEAKLELVA